MPMTANNETMSSNNVATPKHDKKPVVREWMPSQFKADSELSPYERKVRRNRRAREQDDYIMRDFTLGETVANSVSQGVAAFLTLIGLVILVVAAMRHGGGIRLAAALIFSIPMAFCFTMSTLYHALQSDRAKRVFKALDNGSTYLLIAGSLTPYCLLSLGGTLGVGLCIAEWVIASGGMIIESVWPTRPRAIHGVLYVLMFVVFLAFAPQLVASIDPAGFYLFIGATVCLAVSLLFRWNSDVQYLRFVFHIVAFAGCVCLFLSVALFVI